MMNDRNDLNRRHFLKTTAAGVGAAAMGGTVAFGADKKPEAASPTEADPAKLIWRSKNPNMQYARMGRTNYMVSRMVAGIGGDDTLWRRMLDRGMNYFDTAIGYENGKHETRLSNFFKKYRDKIWITSKATDVAGYAKIDDEVAKLYRAAMKDFLGDGEGDLLALHRKAVEKEKQGDRKPDLRPAGRRIAQMYAEMLDKSLVKMKIDCADCYMMHGIEIPWIFDCLELWEAHEKAHKAGKVKHFGFSVHKHHKEVLAAGVEADRRGPWKIDLIMPGVNPSSFDQLKDELAAYKKLDVGIVAMKTSGIKNRPLDGREKKFEGLVGGGTYNEYERAKLWILNLTEGLVDACIAVIENNERMEKNLSLPSVRLSTSAERELRTLVKYEMAGACHLCGDCQTLCPEHIAVTDMIRYHAYVHQYNEKELARQLYALAGYDPAKLCSNCGRCAEVCPSNVRITEILHQLSADMAGA